MAVIPTPPDQPSTLTREITGIRSFLADLAKEGTLEELNNRVGRLKFIIRQTIRGETDETVLEKISKDLGELEEKFKNAEIGGPPLPDTSQRVNAIAQNLQIIQKLKASVDNKSLVYKQRKILASQEKESKEKLIPRFDLLYAKMEKKDPLVLEMFKLFQKIQFKNSTINSNDLEAFGKVDYALREAVSERSKDKKIWGLNVEETAALQKYIENFKERLALTYSSKEKLLNSLNKELEGRTLTPEENLKYAIWHHQIVNNPFELPIEVHYKGCPSLGKLKKEWDTLKIPHNTFTLQCKIEGIQRLRRVALQEKSTEDILISGAGPGGLMAALSAGVQGTSFTLIEARAKGARMRENTLALGKEASPHYLPVFGALDFHQAVATHAEVEAADEKLLEFFGVTDRLVVDGKLEPGQLVFSVKIGELQEAMKQQLCAIMGQSEEELIRYNTVIDNVFAPPGSTQKAMVSLKDRERGSKVLLQPTAVYVTEGVRSKTRSLLGIDVVKQSAAEYLGFAFFKRRQAHGIIETATALMTYLKALWTLFKLALSPVLKGKTLLTYEAFLEAFNRFELLLSTPGSDYFYFTASQEEYEQYTDLVAQSKTMQKQREEWADQMLKELNAKQQEYLRLTPQKHQELLVLLEDEFEGLPESALSEIFTSCIAAFKPENRARLFDDSKEREKVFLQLAILSSAMYPGRAEEEMPDVQMESALLAADRAAHQLKMWEQSNLIEPRAVQNVSMSLMGRVTQWERGRNYNKFLDLPNLVTAAFWVVSEGISSGIATYNRVEHTQTQVRRAETSYKALGQTHFYIGGDAASTTDPASGAGCRTSILRAALAADVLNHSARLADPMETSIFRWTNHLGEMAMREEGIDIRLAYAGATERLERYLDIAQDAEVIDLETRNFLLRMQAKLRLREIDDTITMTIEEEIRLRRIRESLRAQYGGSSFYSESAIGEKKKEQGIEQYAPHLTEDEYKIFEKAWESAMRGTHPVRTFDQIELLRSAIGKVAQMLSTKRTDDRFTYGYYTDAWFVSLDTAIQQMQNGIPTQKT